MRFIGQSTSMLAGFLLLAIVSEVVQSRCMYDLDPQTELPFHIDSEPFEIGFLNACKDYIQPGRLGCCSKTNDKLTMANFKQIDGVFSAQGGGCDICAISLKRFWCQYACSARQHEFMWTDNKFQPYPDPQKPGSIIMSQQVWVRVHTQTACAIYNSCKRNSFVSSVSAMSSPAGFLNFQGHNALNDAHQYINMNFSNNINDSLAFTDILNDFPYADVQTCNYQTSESLIHNFTFSQNCTCNTCQQACNPNEGFQYTEPSIFEGFNFKLVGGTYVAVIVVAVGLSAYRHFQSEKKKTY